MVISLLQQRLHPVILPLAGARVQDEAGGERVAVTIPASTGGDLLPLSSSDEGDVARPPAWQGGRGAAAGRRKKFRRRESRVFTDSSCEEKQAGILGRA